MSAAFAEDFKTVNGKEYKDATITRVEPDGIVVKTKSGITKVYFAELPKEVQERFHYDQQKAGAYSAEQAATYTAYQKQQEYAQREREDAAAKNNAFLLNKKQPKIEHKHCKPATTSFRSRKTICFAKSARQSNPGPHTTVGKTIALCSIIRTRKNPSYQCSRVI